MDYAVIGTVAKGDIVAITGLSAGGNWLQIVTTGGKPGWISGQTDYTRIIGSLQDIPVVEIVPGSTSGESSEPANNSQPVSTASTSEGKLVFTTRSGGDLYIVNADGTGLQKLASGVIDPAVSPDGQQVAFTRWDGAEFGTLYVMNLDGTGERAILGETRQAKSPTWSPDGQEIIVSFQHGGLRDPEQECRRYEFGEEVRLPENAQITGITTIGEKDTLEVCFIPREDLQWGLRRVNLASGQYEDLPADLYSFSPAWDPNQDWRVLYNTDKGLMQLDLTTGEQQSLTSDVRDTTPVFSADGQKLALTYKQHDHWEVYTYDLASGARQRLTKPPLLADPQYSSAAPAWSPDGSQIAFVTDRTGQWEIWLMNADGSNQHPLLPSEVQTQLGLDYQGVNERMLNWIH
jgi:Tol biopolymer transport system component